MMIDKTFTSRRIFQTNLHLIQVFDVRYEWQRGSESAIPFYRFQLPPLQKFAAFTASASTSLDTTSPNAAFYPRKTSKRLKLLGSVQIFFRLA